MKEVAAMCLVTDPRIDGGPIDDDNYGFTVTYTAQFDPGEIGIQFHEYIFLRENDQGAPFGGGNDNLTSPEEKIFTATSQSMNRQRDIAIPRDVADTESGHEEIYAEISLRSEMNLDPAVGPDCRNHSSAGDFNP
ncbi:hypothetical protein AB0K09_15750 [Streptomyces sp. NPDC049577]|uniref:hypothetical protein n=1 Tax=Streptomyces sp. NPDC049577 TaxID=3155153 RepID=UPI003449E771